MESSGGGGGDDGGGGGSSSSGGDGGTTMVVVSGIRVLAAWEPPRAVVLRITNSIDWNRVVVDGGGDDHGQKVQ